LCQSKSAIKNSCAKTGIIPEAGVTNENDMELILEINLIIKPNIELSFISVKGAAPSKTQVQCTSY